MERIKKYEPLWGEWKVTEKIGEGSFGVVYGVERTLVENTSFSAVKLISFNNAEMLKEIKMDETMSAEELKVLKLENAKKSVREAALMDRLQGRANIVTIYDYGIYTNEKTTDVLIRMERLTNLRDHIKTVEVDTDFVLKLGMDICRALESCEKEKIVHRDIKPDNIFINKDGDFKLGDFGLSRQISKSASLSLRKSKGTPLYMPPEAFGWGSGVDNTSDIYSLGLVMYQLLNKGNIPFCQNMSDFDEIDIAIGRRVDMKEQIPIPKGCREELWDVIKKACAYEKGERYRHTTDMRKDLERIRNKPDVENKLFRSIFSSKGILKKGQEAWAANQYEQAFQLFKKAARLGNAEAQNALGYCFYLGYGTEMNEQKALSWFEKAAAQGHEEAENVVKALREQLKGEQPIKLKETKQTDSVFKIKQKTTPKSIQTYHPGDIVTFGSYPQSKDVSAGKQPIEWIVLKKEEDNMFVVSKKVLDCKPYHQKRKAVTWETSDIRYWLNKSFYEMAFCAEDQMKILTTFVKVEENLKYNTKPGRDTKDKVFLLSINEVGRFLPYRECVCKPTEYAKKQGVWAVEDYCYWRLRSPGDSNWNAAEVDLHGNVLCSGKDITYNSGIRPAMWINLEAE